MTQLFGSVELIPVNLDSWLYHLAESLISIHAVEVGTHRWNYSPYNDIFCLEPPSWSSSPELWEKAIDIVVSQRLSARECFIHRDYHPTNILWRGNKISGIIDWSNACSGPAGIDVAWCRRNLIHLYGITVADRFLHAYQSLAGSSFKYHPYWDLITLIEVLPRPPDVYPPWTAFGIWCLNEKIMCERLDEYLVSVMARF